MKILLAAAGALVALFGAAYIANRILVGRQEEEAWERLRRTYGDKGILSAPLTCSTQDCDNCIGHAARAAEPGGYVDVILDGNGKPLSIGSGDEWYPVTDDAVDEIIDMIRTGGAYPVLSQEVSDDAFGD